MTRLSHAGWICPLIVAASLALAAPWAVAAHHAKKPEADPAPAAAKQPLPFAIDPNPSTYQPLPREDLLITHATVLDGAGHRFDDADVLTHDGKIVKIGKALDGGKARQIDAKGRWVTPGLIDVHSHDGTYSMPLTSVDNDASDVSEVSAPIAADTWIEHAINTEDATFLYALQGGVTALQVLPGSTPLIGGRSVIVKPLPAPSIAAMKFPGAPQGVKMACGENPKTHFGGMNLRPNSRQGEMAMLRDEFNQAVAYREAWLKYEADPKATPPARDMKLDTLVALMDGDLRLHIHCYRADDMANYEGLAHEFHFQITAFHHAVEAYKNPALLTKNGTCAVVWPDWWGFKMEANDGIRENAAILDAAGVCVAMHSDSPVIGQRLNIEAAKAAGAGRRMGLPEPPERVIAWITSNPARMMGIGDHTGTLAPGYNADIVIWSADPFSIYSHADEVLIDGAIAYDRLDAKRQPLSDFQLGRPAGEAAKSEVKP